jgi:hypothetical protein
MKFEKVGIAISASLVVASFSYNAAFSAVSSADSASTSTSADSPPELQSAQQRVEMSKAKLDQAKQQLSAAKAMLRAADAEFKAARADQEALSLRTQARKLADASGLQETLSTGNRLYPVAAINGAQAPVAASPLPGNGSDVTSTTSVSATEVSEHSAQALALPASMPTTP